MPKMSSPGGTEDWKTRATRKYQQCQSLIPADWRLPPAVTETLSWPLETSKTNLVELDIPRRSGILTERELHITEGYDVASLLKALASGEVTSLEVTTAFCKRAAIAQQLTSCLTEIFFERALGRARELDALRENGQLVGPLHGLPVSLKDSFLVEGTDSTVGFVAYLDHGPHQENSCLVEVLLGLGAVLYCKTNIPQTLMTADSHNNIFGRALNPWNTRLTAGGSSGGEGALVAFRGSPLGVGTDVAGSIRIPSLCCGTYGFKPSALRIPYGKQVPFGNPGLRSIQPSAGPIANDLEALGIFARAVIDSRPALLDHTALDVPWRPGIDAKPKLRFGVLAEDPLFPVHPPVRRALAEAAALLRAAGHETIELTPQEGLIGVAYDVALQIFGLDRTSFAVVQQAGEPFIPSISKGGKAVRELRFDRSIVPDTRAMDDGLARLSLLNVKRGEIQEAWLKLWAKYRLDAVIAPGAQNTAVEHDEYGPAPYTAILNLLDYPACAIPFGKATKSYLPEAFEVPAGSFAPPYNPETLEGAPLSIQVFTSRLRDEECLAVAKTVDACLNPKGHQGVPSARI